jgi:hypothetical protein
MLLVLLLGGQHLETPGIAVLDSFVLVTTMEGCAGSQIGMRQETDMDLVPPVVLIGTLIEEMASKKCSA